MKQGNFSRGLKPEFIERLNDMYESGNWWRNFVDDEELFLAIRNNYLNVYYRGCSLLKLEWRNYKGTRDIVGKIHYKYLLRSRISGSEYIEFINGIPSFQENLGGKFIGSLIEINDLKSAAEPYVEDEKAGVHEIVLNNPGNILDIEVAFKNKLRLDFAALRKTDDEQRVEIVFFEAKHFKHSGLRARNNKNPKVFEQLTRYSEQLTEARHELEESYRNVCYNLRYLNGIDNQHSKRHELLEIISKKPSLLKIDDKPRLVVFGFDSDQRDGKNWKQHREKLEDKFGSHVKFYGNANNCRLDW